MISAGAIARRWVSHTRSNIPTPHHPPWVDGMAMALCCLPGGHHNKRFLSPSTRSKLVLTFLSFLLPAHYHLPTRITTIQRKESLLNSYLPRPGRPQQSNSQFKPSPPSYNLASFESKFRCPSSHLISHCQQRATKLYPPFLLIQYTIVWSQHLPYPNVGASPYSSFGFRSTVQIESFQLPRLRDTLLPSFYTSSDAPMLPVLVWIFCAMLHVPSSH